MFWKRYLYILLVMFLFSRNSGTEEYLFEFRGGWVNPTEYKINLKSHTLSIHSFEYIRTKELDSTITHLNKVYKISPENLHEFTNKMNQIILDTSCVSGDTDYLHGFGFRFSKIGFPKDTISLTSRNPRRNLNFEIDYKILDAFFPLANRTVMDYEEMSITERIQNNFSYGLAIKKVDENPTEYRVWGTIGCSDTNNDLIEFLDSLPVGRPIVFDTRNGRFLPCVISQLKEHANKQIYFYGNFELEESLKGIRESEKLLEMAYKKNDLSNIGKNKVNKRDEEKYIDEIINEIEDNPNHFFTKDEVLKTIEL